MGLNLKKVNSIEEILELSKGLTRREIYKTKVSFICQNCGTETEVSLRQFKERGKNKLLCQKCDTKEKNIDKYGVDNIFRTKSFIVKNKENKLKKDRILEICENNDIELLEDYNGVHIKGNWKYYNVKCKKCGNIFETYFCDRAKNSCPICFPKTISNGERELREFVEQNYHGEIIFNDRTILSGKELDIYIPELKIAVEYDGVYWHNGVNNYFKYEECKKQGIRLIHIIENTWIQKKEIVKSILRTYLNIQPKKYYARKCEVKEISEKIYKDFCEKNNLQGYETAIIKLGLFHNNELIQIMSFNSSFEIVRECSKLNCGVIGGKDKLLKYLERKYNPKEITSYCWKDYFDGKSYINSGFKLVKETEPNCFYAKSNLSSLERKENDEYLKIFDYGNFVFKK